MSTPTPMNTPITEAQYQLAHEIRQSSYQEKAAQLIADSEARAIATQLEVVVVLTRRWLAVEKERDQLRAEVERLKKDNLDMGHWIGSKMYEPEWDSFKKSLEVIDHWKARAEKAEAELISERSRLDWLDQQGAHYGWKVQLPTDYPNVKECVFVCRNTTSGHKTIREAIDTAMKEGAK